MNTFVAAHLLGDNRLEYKHARPLWREDTENLLSALARTFSVSKYEDWVHLRDRRRMHSAG
jgi:hypothetical protein